MAERTDLEGLGPTELLPIEPFSTWNRLSAASGLTLLLLEQIEGETSFPSQTDAQQQTQQKSVLKELHPEPEPCSSWEQMEAKQRQQEGKVLSMTYQMEFEPNHLSFLWKAVAIP